MIWWCRPAVENGMLGVVELRILDRWCAARRLAWRGLPGPAMDGRADGQSLRIAAPGRGGVDAMYLTGSAGGYVLQDFEGAALAIASDLPALLDAVDAGVAEPLRNPFHARQVASAA
jgi:hypothetical protein